MKEQLCTRRRWHLDEIQRLSESIREHVNAIAEIERLLASPELPGLGGTLPPAPPAPAHLVPAAPEPTPAPCRCATAPEVRR
jgi:hypothetical protein